MAEDSELLEPLDPSIEKRTYPLSFRACLAKPEGRTTVLFCDYFMCGEGCLYLRTEGKLICMG